MSWVGAPATWTSSRLVAPSPSAAIVARQLVEQLRERGGERDVARRVDAGQLRVLGAAVGEHEHAVVGAHVAVDRELVEGLAGRAVERVVEQLRRRSRSR